MLWRRLEYGFLARLLLCLVSYFSLFFFLFFLIFFLHPGMFIFVSLRLCSSQLLLTVSTYFIVRVLSACCVICTLPHVGVLLFSIRVVFFFVALAFRRAFFYCALVPGTLALDLPTLHL